MNQINQTNQKREPLAIIGIGCRFPGEANDPESFWKLLRTEVDAVTEIPEDRWAIEKYYHPEPGAPGKTYSRWGGFIKGIDQFEPECFGISPSEASYMDPQHRLLLEVAWEALEDAGQVIDRQVGMNAGVFIGISTSDYAQIQLSPNDNCLVDAHTATGGVFSIAANRISYCLNLRGPSMAVDTACSSSLVAADLACRSLWNGESDLALAGGVNIIIGPGPFVAFSAASMLSADGRCKAFDASANGFVRGEGAGIIVLKPLFKALADGNSVYAVIVGSAVNQDGRTSGITVPSQSAQEALLREACRQGGIVPSAIHYLEAHGTGTAIGDPIEAAAMGNVLSSGRPSSRQLYEMPKPTIAMIRGAAAGAGLSLALACDMRIASDSARFTTAFAKVGFSGDYGGSYFLPRLVGAGKARELYLTADILEAAAALEVGLVNRVVADADLESEVRAFAAELASGPAIAYRYIKKNLNASADGASLSDVFDLEAWNMTRTGMTDDHKEAARAFVEKRKPTFQGR